MHCNTPSLFTLKKKRRKIEKTKREVHFDFFSNFETYFTWLKVCLEMRGIKIYTLDNERRTMGLRELQIWWSKLQYKQFSLKIRNRIDYENKVFQFADAGICKFVSDWKNFSHIYMQIFFINLNFLVFINVFVYYLLIKLNSGSSRVVAYKTRLSPTSSS